MSDETCANLQYIKDMEEHRIERLKSKPYDNSVIDFIKLLAEKEGCSSSMIHELTGVPLGTVSSMGHDRNIQIPFRPPGGAANMNQIRRARKMKQLREKYGETIGQVQESVKKSRSID